MAFFGLTGCWFRFELPLGAFSPLPVAVGSSNCYDVQPAGAIVVAAGAIVVAAGAIVVAAGFLVVDYGVGIDAANAIVLLISAIVIG